MDGQGDAAVASAEDRVVPPARRGSRDQRRETTLRALAAGDEAYCAYCGQVLPPLPSRGGRPTPYCPADPQRYGNWGAKTITCAMLDEHREIWVQVYGPDQPMTQLDVHALDERMSAVLAVLDPVRTEVAALQQHATGELSSALDSRDTADAERRQAEKAARAAEAERDRAVADAERARAEVEAARGEQAAAAQQAEQALADRDQALSERRAAQEEAEAARTDRQHALDRVSAAHERITGLQSALAEERATALERLDELRRQEEQARQSLRAALTEEHEQRLREQSQDFTQRLRDLQRAADERVAELTEQLTSSTRGYAESLAPLHEEIGTLRRDLAARTAAATDAHRRLDALRDSLGHALDATGDDEVRQRLRGILERLPVADAHADDHAQPQDASPSDDAS